MKGMVLCAGLGTRLRPITNRRHKCLLPLMTKPIVSYVFGALGVIGIRDVVVNTHHLAEDVKREISAIEGDRFRLKFSHEPEILGPVGGIRKALPMFEGETFVVVNGDIVLDVNIERVAEQHRERVAALTMAVMDGGARPELASIGYDEEFRVRTVWDKPDWKGKLRKGINIGAFVYEPEILEKYVPEGVFYDFRTQLMPALLEKNEIVCACPVEGYWNDVGTAASYLGAHRDLFDGKAPGIFKPSMLTPHNDERHSVIQPSLVAGDAFIEEGAVIGPYTVAGADCHIGKRSIIEECVVMPRARVADGVAVKREIIMD